MKKGILILIPLCGLFSCEFQSPFNPIPLFESDKAEFTPVDSFGIHDKLPENELKVEATGFAKMNEKAIEQAILKFSKYEKLAAFEKISGKKNIDGAIYLKKTLRMVERKRV